MKKFFKSRSAQVFRGLLIVVLFAKLSNWFLDFTDETNQLLNMIMFSLIGLAYLSYSWAFDRFFLKVIFFICGGYLMLMNFLPDSAWKSSIGIISIVIPIIIGRFIPEEKQEFPNP